jgi:diguanylate cyclase (GGDEF)-like protein/PAS domain S-box-containing protein
MERKRSSRAGVQFIPESHRLREEIAQHKQARQALLASEERYRVLIGHLPVGVYRTTPEGQIIEANSSLAEMIGAQKTSDLYSLNVRDLYVKKQDREEHLHKLDSKTTFFTEFELRRLDGRRIWVRDLPHAVKDLGGRILYYDGIIVDITARKKAERQLHKALVELERVNQELISQSLTDDLTGLHNRRGFFTLGQQTLKIAKRLHDNVCLLYLDIDDLKVTNDTWGHKAGDKVLADFGHIVREAFRESDIIGRIGGDEFAVLILTSSPKRDRVLLERLKEKLTAYNQKKTNKFKISVSIGLVRRAARRQPSLDNLIRLADRRMYRQKRRKRKSDALAAGL